MHILLSHDVDWPKKGPGSEHILARRNRFDDSVLKLVMETGFNPYYGIPIIMDLERSLGIRSTFFFRPLYDDLSAVDEYREDILALKRGGWEVGLHANDAGSIDSLRREKSKVEGVLGDRVSGIRTHYLRITENVIRELGSLGLIYDSSICLAKERIEANNAGYYKLGSVIEFPITIMDAYLFSYMGLNESNLVGFLVREVERLSNMGIVLATLLWHDNALFMKGGRLYGDLLKELISRDKVSFIRGIDAVKIAEKGPGGDYG